jgi:nucleoid-associated protein YgaU
VQKHWIIGAVGVAVIVAAIGLNYVIDREPAPAPAGAPPAANGSAAGGGPATPQNLGRPVRPSFDVVRVNPKGDAVIAGRAAPNAEVVVRSGDTEVGRVTADGRGEWVLVPAKPLPPGSHELSLEATGPDGAKLQSESSVVMVVPQPGRDVAGRPASGEQAPLVLRVPQGGGPATVMQSPARGAGSGKLALESADFDDKGKTTISGQATPGARVELYVDNKHAGSAQADAEGRWSITPDTPLAPGEYKLRADEIGPQGKVTARMEVPFTRPPQMAGVPNGMVAFVQPGNSLWRIALRTLGHGTRYTVIYDANKDQIRNPDLIYPGQVFLIPQTN